MSESEIHSANGPTSESDAKGVTIGRGNIYIESGVYLRYFNDIETIALLPSGDQFLILPIFSQASGGRILKLRNSRGDRVVHAADFLREHGIEDDKVLQCYYHWDSAAAALVVSPVWAQP
jgi:hypothetical protein